MRQVTIESLLDYPIEMRREAWRTAGKPTAQVPALTARQLQRYFIAEHSPMRMTLFRATCEYMNYFTHIHFVRHTFLQPFVVSHRPDKTGQARTLADTVTMTLVGNAQAWIDMMQVRLCYKSASDTQAWAVAIKQAFAATHPEFAACLVPQCVYRYSCSEPKTCGWFEQQDPPMPITERYAWYAEKIRSESESRRKHPEARWVK